MAGRSEALYVSEFRRCSKQPAICAMEYSQPPFRNYSGLTPDIVSSASRSPVAAGVRQSDTTTVIFIDTRSGSSWPNLATERVGG